ncbi:hypothetical protein DMENIID0001_104080 [Sergentomyia squamirostris]
MNKFTSVIFVIVFLTVGLEWIHGFPVTEQVKLSIDDIPVIHLKNPILVLYEQGPIALPSKDYTHSTDLKVSYAQQ